MEVKRRVEEETFLLWYNIWEKNYSRLCFRFHGNEVVVLPHDKLNRICHVSLCTVSMLKGCAYIITILGNIIELS